jgi:GNAT superfamily N-acetyltransferase
MAGNGEIRLRDGRVVTLRVAAAADEPGIAELYAGLSPESFRSRFHSGRPKPPLIARLARIDVAPGAVSLVAETGSGRLAAEARYVPTAEDAGELALGVLDDFQGLGLGRRMLSALIDHANAAGLDRLSAVVILSNDTMLHLLTRYGSALTEPADENFVVCLEISATGGMPGWPPRDAATGQRDAATGQRILVERRGWFEDRRVAALRAAGHEVRQCTGPDRRSGRTCPLVEEGRCRLAEDADRIVTMLPGDADCLAVTEAHSRLWPGKLTRQSARRLAAEP